MNHNVYLPDDISAKAKAAGFNLSGLLRDAVIDELERSASVSQTLTATQNHLLELEDDEGRSYTGRLAGTVIAYDDSRDVTVYLAGDERVIVYDAPEGRMWTLDDPEESLRDWLPAGLYTDAMHALGIKPVVDL